MRWTVNHANAVIALRCCQLSGRREEFWEQRSVGWIFGGSSPTNFTHTLAEVNPAEVNPGQGACRVL